MSQNLAILVGHDNVWEMRCVTADEIFRPTIQTKGKKVNVSVESTPEVQANQRNKGQIREIMGQVLEGRMPMNVKLDPTGWWDFTVRLACLNGNTDDVVSMERGRASARIGS